MLFCVVKDIELFRSVTSLTNDCPDIRLIWDLEDPLAVFRNYPWTRHGLKDSSLGYKFPTANYRGEEIVGFDICAMHCTGTSENGDTCFQCKKLKKKVNHLRQLSNQPPRRLNYQYQTHEQLTQGHCTKNKIIEDFLKCPLCFTDPQAHEYSRTLTCPGNMAPPRNTLKSMIASCLPYSPTRMLELNQLIRVYTHQGASRSAITQASASLWNLRSYTHNEYDMAMIMFRTGGRKLVYAANHALGLPSMAAI